MLEIIKHANELLKSNKKNEAIKLVENIDLNEIDDFTNIYLLGEFYFNCNNYQRAVIYFEKLQKNGVKANVKDFWFKLGKSYEKTNSLTLALECYYKVIELDNAFASPWNGIGNVYFYLEQYEEALAAYEKSIKLDGTFALPWHGKGTVYSDLKQYEEALTAYDKAIELDCTDAFPWYGKGVVYSDLKQYEEALAAYDKAIELDDTFALPWNGKGNVYNDLKQYAEALAAYNRAIELDCTDALPWNGKGNVYNVQNQYVEALAAYEKAIELDCTDASPWHGKGNVYNDLNQYEEALVAYDKAIELDDTFASPWHGKGNVYYDLKQYQEAQIAYDRAIELDCTDALPWHGKGNVYSDLDQYEKALAAYDKAIALDDSFASPWIGKGNVYNDLKQYAEALAACDRAIELDCTDALPWNGKGNVYSNLDQYKEALAAYDKAIELNATLASPWHGKALIYFELEDYINTLRHITRCFYLSNQGKYFDRFIASHLKMLRRIEAPFLAKKLFSLFDATSFLNWITFFNNTLQTCDTTDKFLDYLKLNNEHKVNPVKYYTTVGILSYYMGDSLAAYNIFDNYTDKIDDKDLPSQYYFVLSSIGFCEPHESILNYAIKSADDYAFTYRTEFDKRQMYYAGLLFILNNDYEKAIECLDRAIEYPPSEFMKVICYKNLKCEKVKSNLILSLLEKEVNKQFMGFSYFTPIEEIYLEPDSDDFDSGIFLYAHHKEVNEAILEIFEYIRIETKDGEDKTACKFGRYKFLDSYKKPELVYNVWKINKHIFAKLGDLKKKLSLDQLSEMLDELRFELDGINRLINKNSDELGEELEFLISGKRLPSLELTHKLINYLYFSDKISYQSKLLFHFYATLKYPINKNIDLKKAFSKEFIKKIAIYSILNLSASYQLLDNDSWIKEAIIFSLASGFSHYLIENIPRSKIASITLLELKSNFIEIVSDYYNKYQNDDFLNVTFNELELIS